MALRIFDTDPEAAQKAAKRKKASNFVRPAFQFRTGMQTDGRPVSLSKWRVLTDDQKVADGIAELFGGSVTEWDPTKDMNLQVLTDADSVEIVINGSKAIEDKLILWGRGGPIHECDGEFFLSPPEDKGTPCGCPTTLKARKAAARAGRGPSPSIGITFTLAGLGEDLGTGKLTAGGWSLAEVIHEVKAALDQVDGPALCRLSIVGVEFTNPDGELIRFKKPVIDVLGSYNDAIADER